MLGLRDDGELVTVDPDLYRNYEVRVVKYMSVQSYSSNSWPIADVF